MFVHFLLVACWSDRKNNNDPLSPGHNLENWVVSYCC
jgi:hypothetical protein